MRRTGAVLVIRNRKLIGYRMRDGSVACLKRRYRTDIEARADLVHIWARSNHDHVPVRAYRCEFCHGHHLTSRRDRA